MVNEGRARRVLHWMHLMKVAAGAILLAAFSWEILWGPNHRVSEEYLRLQLVVCLLFLLDFLVEWALAERQGRYFVNHLLFLFFSIPWLNLIAWSGVVLPRAWSVFFSMMPVWLLVMSVWFLIDWIDRIRLHRLFFTYSVGVVVVTYLSALLFYEFELGVNGGLHGFGDALWWAGVNLTTAGASLIPTTVIGKALSVLLPLIGMLFLPIFTTYIMNRYNGKNKEQKTRSKEIKSKR